MSINETRIDFAISKKGMTNIKSPLDATEDCDRLTKYYEDIGQLRWSFGRGIETQYAYFIRGEDHKMFVVIEPIDKALLPDLIKQHLDPNIKSTVIKCRIPTHQIPYYEYGDLGVTLFLMHFHPVPEMRGEARTLLWGTAFQKMVYGC